MTTATTSPTLARRAHSATQAAPLADAPVPGWAAPLPPTPRCRLRSRTCPCMGSLSHCAPFQHVQLALLMLALLAHAVGPR